MPNIFDTSGAVQAVTANQTPIQSGVVDTSTADAIKAAATIGGQAVKQIGSQKVANEVKNILEHPETIEVPELAPYMDRLGKIADGVKAGMQRNKAQIMARKVLAEAINQHPFYAKEIRERAAGLFGIGGGAGGTKIQQSPEEKALNDYREQVTKTQLEFGVSQQTAQNIIETKRQDELRKITAANFTDDVYIAVADATTQTQDTIFKTVFQSPTGTLSLEEQRSLEINIERSSINLQQTLMREASKRGAVTKEIFETIDNQVRTYKENAKALVKDQTAMKWMKDHNDLAAEQITAWGNQNYGGLIYLAKSNLISDQDKSNIWRALGNDERAKALIKNNPFLGDLLTKSQNLSLELKRGYAGVVNDMVGIKATTTEKEQEKVSENDKHVALSLMLNDRASGAKFNKGMLKEHSATSQESVDNMLKVAPENIIRWVSPQYEAAFADDPKLKRQTIEHEADIVSRTLRARIFAEGIDAGEFDAITFREPRKELEEVQGFSKFYGAGASAPKFSVVGVQDNYVKSRLMDLYRVLEANPDVWESVAESPSEYIDKLIKRPVDWKMPTRMKVNKSKNLGLGEGTDTGMYRPRQTANNYTPPSYMKDTEKGGPRTDADYEYKVQEAVKGFKEQGLTLSQVLNQMDNLGLNRNAEFMARRQEIIDEWERS
ncbi:hypothetical protein [Vibrio phage VP41s3]|nr:hypothetical protein [Vibrio phage VP41s3]